MPAGNGKDPRASPIDGPRRLPRRRAIGIVPPGGAGTAPRRSGPAVARPHRQVCTTRRSISSIE